MPYTPAKKDSVQEIPSTCPLLRTCQQRIKDLQEYQRLKQKWTKYAKEQETEEVKVDVKAKKGRKTKKVKIDWAQEVAGSQVFYLEYGKNAQERLANMCPHVKKEELGLITKEPPYLECQLFSEWYYSQKR
ncbi:hypothetical protein CH330_01405 [candidate division WOR-3 bacterium JGI_Cruoil_03_51_56]|uniref:Uncharacterized protein n=1 Tax=candidate division WOR-3 bacterium JGI_Cruoil_03_51_56 TaxID=1973747 RepID=A0A235BX85_UNCW3|nr:MAG: hypothetical protein CH330_01405 [candidate division WOR-3 bacterium JGI_Cruoil_03_51_56]